MRTKNLPEVGPELFVTDKEDVVRIVVERPAWVTTQVCIVRVEDNKVSWIETDKLTSKNDWDMQKKKENEDHEQNDDQGELCGILS